MEIKKAKALLNKSFIQCAYGGIVTVNNIASNKLKKSSLKKKI